MHGLTGGSWKRSADLTMVIEKNSPGGKPHGLKWLRDLPSTDPTAPAPDPPSDVVGKLLSASGAGGGNSEAARWRDRVLGVPTVADRVAQTVVSAVSGAEGRTDLPSGLLRLSAEEVRVGRGRHVPAALLEG